MPTCLSCGTENPEGFRFCGRCRSPLAEAAPERRKTVTVLFGDAGAGEAFVSGDAVNVAARLEQTAGAGEVLVGELTYRLIRRAVTTEPVEPLALKGKEKPVPAYRLVGVAAEGGVRVGRTAG